MDDQSIETLCLIDGSAFAYIHAGKINYKETMLDHLYHILLENKANCYCIFREKSSTNFRKKVAITQGYKAQRAVNKQKYDPDNKYSPYLDECLDYLIELGSEIYYGVENDDAISMAFHEFKTKYKVVICGDDSDLLSIQGHHYRIRTKAFMDLNPIDKNDLGFIDFKDNGKLIATGLFNTYAKMIKGSTKENYKGVEGLGEKAAYNLLKDCKSEQEMWNAACKAFYNKYKENGKERIEEGFKLSYLLEYNKYFTTPKLYPVSKITDKINSIL